MLNNTLRHKLRCGTCEHEFSPRDGACVRCTGETDKMYDLHCCKARVCATCSGELAASSSGICDVCNKRLVRK
jgi:hypothetical protein